MANDETKELSNLAEVFKALGHPTRLWIVKNLDRRELCVCDFVNGTGEEFSTISQHLNVLKNAHVVEGDKRGKHVFYHLVYPCIPWLIACMELRDQADSRSPRQDRSLIEKQLQSLIEHLQEQKNSEFPEHAEHDGGDSPR